MRPHSYPSQFSLDQLVEWAGRHGVMLGTSQMAQLRCHLETLLAWNRRMSLVSQNDQAEILCKHFADSLALAEVCSTGARVVDLGSGAGFPGLPLAVARPDIDLWLVESSAKKTSFLLHVISLAEVRNAHVANTRIEALVSDPRHSGRYSLAVARAFGELVEFLRSALPLLSESGRAVAMKGPRYRAELDNADVPDIGFLPPQVTEYQLPDGSERRLLCFERRP